MPETYRTHPPEVDIVLYNDDERDDDVAGVIEIKQTSVTDEIEVGESGVESLAEVVESSEWRHVDYESQGESGRQVSEGDVVDYE